MENLYVKLAAYLEIETERTCVRSLLKMHRLCLSMLLMKQLRATLFQPIKV